MLVPGRFALSIQSPPLAALSASRLGRVSTVRPAVTPSFRSSLGRCDILIRCAAVGSTGMSGPLLQTDTSSTLNTTSTQQLHPPRGAFIVFEGLDRSGKTTQSTKLQQHLQACGVPCQLMRFPDRTTATGMIIHKYLTSTEPQDDRFMHQIFAANRSEKRDDITKLLSQGQTVIVDRYAYSGVAYTAAKGKAGLDFRWCKCIDEGLPAPDVVFYMQTAPATLAARAGYGEERYEKVEFQQKVKHWFEELVAPNWTVLDADSSIDTIHDQVAQKADSVIANCKQGAPIRRLWDLQPVVPK